MTQIEAADTLRKTAEALETSAKRLAMPRETYTLTEAMEAVRAAVPGRSIQIGLSFWVMTHTGTPLVTWKVWDEFDHFEAATLTQAVRLCIAHHAQPKDALAQAETVLAEAQAAEGGAMEPDGTSV